MPTPVAIFKHEPSAEVDGSKESDEAEEDDEAGEVIDIDDAVIIDADDDHEGDGEDDKDDEILKTAYSKEIPKQPPPTKKAKLDSKGPPKNKTHLQIEKAKPNAQTPDKTATPPLPHFTYPPPQVPTTKSPKGPRMHPNFDPTFILPPPPPPPPPPMTNPYYRDFVAKYWKMLETERERAYAKHKEMLKKTSYFDPENDSIGHVNNASINAFAPRTPPAPPLHSPNNNATPTAKEAAKKKTNAANEKSPRKRKKKNDDSSNGSDVKAKTAVAYSIPPGYRPPPPPPPPPGMLYQGALPPPGIPYYSGAPPPSGYHPYPVGHHFYPVLSHPASHYWQPGYFPRQNDSVAKAAKTKRQQKAKVTPAKSPGAKVSE